MVELVQDGKHDNTLALLSEGYDFIHNRCQRHETDVFATRLMLKPVVCMLGAEAARQFYHPGRFTRSGAMPPTTLMLLQDKGSVQQKDGAVHARRKQMFMNIMNRGSIERLLDIFRRRFREASGKWTQHSELVLHREFEILLTASACEWAGIELDAAGLRERSHEFSAMIDAAGSVGPKSWWALLLRSRTEHWAQRLIEDLRKGGSEGVARPQSALFQIAWHREEGELMSSKTAAVELLNILRPTVAVSRYLTFAALALHDYPETRESLRFGNPDYLHRFAQELRRFYPFFPFVGGRVKQPFEWRGHQFAEGDWVLLDLYGTNRDARSWRDPERFEPDRFRNWDESAYNFIPQGGGEFISGHRCAGEWLTIELIKAATELLVNEVRYTVPEQDLHLDLSHIPTLPSSGLLVREMRPVSMAGVEHGSNVRPFPAERRTRQR